MEFLCAPVSLPATAFQAVLNRLPFNTGSSEAKPGSHKAPF